MAQKHPVEGKWRVNPKKRGEFYTAIFDLKVKSGKLDGEIEYDGKYRFKLLDPQIKGNKATWQCEISDLAPVRMKVETVFNGDSMKGSMKTVLSPPSYFEGHRIVEEEQKQEEKDKQKGGAGKKK